MVAERKVTIALEGLHKGPFEDGAAEKLYVGHVYEIIIYPPAPFPPIALLVPPPPPPP